jgi:acetylornithine deacetylase
MDPAELTDRAIAELTRLVAFDTTSRLSNLALIEHVEALLAAHGVRSRRVANADGSKANLLASIGPGVEGGVVLSGHTDVVPVDGQPWSSDPFALEEREGRLYGRGTCDMKGFLALSLAALPAFAAAGLRRPVHLAFSYDEEVGCLGAPDLIRALVADLPRPGVVVVGEPTDMQAVSGHKGIAVYTVTVRGKEAHSSRTDLGASAIMAAVRLMAVLQDTAERLTREAQAGLFHPAGATLTIGQVGGGTATNILARECVFAFDLRCPPGMGPEAVLAPFQAAVAEVDAELKRWGPEAGVVVAHRSTTPPLSPEAGGAAERLARALTGDNGPERAVAYAAEAGQFQQAGFSTVICGPGSIDQAHQADEFVERSQMERGALFMLRLAEHLSKDPA